MENKIQKQAIAQLQKQGFKITHEFVAEFPPFKELIICMAKKIKSTSYHAQIDSEGLVNGLKVEDYIKLNTKNL